MAKRSAGSTCINATIGIAIAIASIVIGALHVDVRGCASQLIALSLPWYLVIDGIARLLFTVPAFIADFIRGEEQPTFWNILPSCSPKRPGRAVFEWTTAVAFVAWRVVGSIILFDSWASCKVDAPAVRNIGFLLVFLFAFELLIKWYSAALLLLTGGKNDDATTNDEREAPLVKNAWTHPATPMVIECEQLYIWRGARGKHVVQFSPPSPGARSVV